MGATSKIEWTDATWNPTRGCSRVSPGCDHCYAMGIAYRFSGPDKPFEGLAQLRKGKPDWTGNARLVPEMLSVPLRWRKPRRVFVNSMSDLFHPSLPDAQIDAVFGVMWACLYLGKDCVPGHVFQVLTKRPERAAEYLSSDRRAAWAQAAVAYGGGVNPDGLYDQVMYYDGPHPRIWLGTSVENQECADKRIPELLACLAAVRFISAEPLLGSLNLREVRCPLGSPSVDWVIVGGESGHGARPFDIAWARLIVDQCKAAGVPCFVKQLGARPYEDGNPDWPPRAPGEYEKAKRRCARAGGVGSIYPNDEWRLFACSGKLKDPKGGDWSEWPEDLRVREFPTGSP